MATLSLRISIVEKNVIKTMQFDPSTSVYDACRVIREKISEANLGQPKDYGLFLADEDVKKGVWLEPGRNLDYYILRNGDLLEYRKKMRTLKVRMLDGTLKTMLVDDSQPVANLMVVICTKIGITNHDEYSLVRECPEDEVENKPNFGTLTLKRKKEEKERDVKMEQLRKKLKTDDEVNWVDPSKTLREQGIDEGEPVLLRRKFFFSDQNIDSRDPVQLNLLYVQARDAILDGTHPITQEMACELAGIQSHIQFGDFNEAKHKPPFLDLKEFLPQSYVKVKGIEKKIFIEHSKHVGSSELEAKVLYTKTARSLKTYGVTFFLVKEKMKGKNKLVPRLLGVTKDSVLRLDERTKEILKTWPLTTVRRWGASPNTFTLDFGDYSDQYYSVQTQEAEQILQLISGYIDIILKKKKSKDHFGIEGDEGSTMVEDSVAPLKATILQHESSRVGKVNTESVAKPAIMRAADGAKPYGMGHAGAAQYTTISGQINIAHSPPTVQQTQVTSILSEPQQALLGTISAGHQVITTVEKELITKAEIPELGTDPASLKWKETTLDTNKQNVSSQLAAMNAATAQVVTLTSGPADKVDHTAVGAAITTITSNLPEMSRGVRMLAALMDDDLSGDKLLDAARKLCSAFSDLLKAAEPEAKEDIMLKPRQNLLNAASRVGEASHRVLTEIGEENYESRDLQDTLLGLAKAVANTTAALVLKAKSIASTMPPDQQNKVIVAATQCALSTSQLVACAKVVAPTIHNAACQQQLIQAIREVTQAVEGLVAICNESCNDDYLLKELTRAAADVTQTLNNLLNRIKLISRETAKESVQESSVEQIYIATDRLFASTGDAGEMVRQARVLGQATTQLIQAIKGEAEKQPDSELQRRLLAAAKVLAEATARMVEAARQCAENPHDPNKQQHLRQTVEDLRAATTLAATPALRKKLIQKLEKSAKLAASTATQCIASAHGVAHHNANKSSQEELMSDCRTLADRIPPLIQGVKGTNAEPDNPTTQLNLINASHQFLQPGQRVVACARAVLPTITDQSSALHLSGSSQALGAALSELRASVGRAREACGPELELEAAHNLVCSLRDELVHIQHAAEKGHLRPLPGETAVSASQQLGSVSKNVKSSMAQVVSAATQGNENYTAMATRDMADSLKDFTGAVRAVVANTDVRETRQRMIFCTEELMNRSLGLIEEARRTLQEPSNAENLNLWAKRVTQSLDDSVSCLPGQRDVDDAISTISSATAVLDSGCFPHTDKPYNRLQAELNSAAAGLNEASTSVITSVGSPNKLANASKKFGTAVGDVINVGMEMAGQTKDTEVQGQMVVSLKNVSVVSSKLLITAKTVAADPAAPNAKNQLASAARAVTDSINYLVDVCTSAAPGQKECDNAIRNIQSMKPLLDCPSEPINDASYFECLDTVMEKSKCLGDGMTGIATHAKKCEHEQFGESVRSVSNSICGLIEPAAQAAYLLAASDPSSIPAKQGLVDQAQFARAYQAVQGACSTLSNSASKQNQVLQAATIIAKHTSSLCNACRIASSKTTNPVAKRHFVQSAKDVANSTANLVKEIKALDLDYSEKNREACSAATRPLLEAVDSLVTFANSSEFTTQMARISHSARAAQEPITSAGCEIIDASCAVIRAAKSLAVAPKDPPTWKMLANHSKSVSDSIKKLVASIRDKAPGQKECDEAIDRLKECIRDLDQAALLALSQNLPPRRDNSLQGFAEQTESSAAEISDRLDPLRIAAKMEAEIIGHTVKQLIVYFDPLVSGAIGAASNMVHSKQQSILLDQSKTVVECALQLMYVTKECGGNPKAINIHPEIDEYVAATRDALSDLSSTFEHLATQAGVVTGLLDTITRAMAKVPDPKAPQQRVSFILDSTDSYVDYQTRMVAAAKEIARIGQDMVMKSSSSSPDQVAQVGVLAAQLTHQYAQLATDSAGAAVATANAEVSARLAASVQELGRACLNIVGAAGSVQASPADTLAHRDLADNAHTLSEKVSQVLAALQAGSRGTQACINAASTVSGIIGDLDTTIMFATAGTLHAENENETFADHRENILKTARALVEDTKTLVAGAASSQEQLAVAAQNAVTTIVQLADVVKYGAASLGSNNPEAQVMLINAVKDVASALGDLIQATKAASGKSINDPSMNHLKDSAKVMVTNITSLLKTVKAVEDEHTRGTRALESTIEAIAQEIRALGSVEATKKKATPEELVRCTKPITVATAKAVAAGNSCKQEDIIVAANMGRKAISDMLTICKGTSNTAETSELKTRVLQAGQNVALQYRELLQSVLHILSRPGTTDARQGLPPISIRIAQSVTELVAVAELLKGTDWVDPDDPTVVAENELLGAAASIDAAAKKLASLRPRKSVTQETDESLNFDEMILEAAKSIAAATSALVKAASAAQRELIDKGKVNRTPLTSSDDGQWSEGLISAARLVAAATHSLVESANSLVQGVSSEEKLVSSAKQVASSTAQLLVACKVKADPDSDTTKRLQAAGNAVKRATDNLVRAAQQAIQQEEERSLVLNRRMVGGIAQEINARSEVLRIERELEEARSRLTAIRQAKYKMKGGDSPSDTEAELYGTSTFNRYDSSTASQQHYSSLNNSLARPQSSADSPYSNGATPERMYVSSVESRTKVYNVPKPYEGKMYSSSSPPPPPPPLPSAMDMYNMNSNSDSTANYSVTSQIINGNGKSESSLEQRMLKQTVRSVMTTTTTSNSYIDQS